MFFTNRCEALRLLSNIQKYCIYKQLNINPCILVVTRLWSIFLIPMEKIVMMIYLYHGYDNNRYITINIFKYHILLIYPQEFSFPFPLLTLFKFLSTRKTIFSIGCRTLFMYPDPRWYGMIPSVWNCRNLRHMKIYFEYQYVQILYKTDPK